MNDTLQKIQAAYEHDQQHKPEAVTADELPATFESMTERWLTAVLCRDVPGAKVVGHQLGPVDNGSSNRRRVEVEYNDVGLAAGLPLALFCKASFDLANRMTLAMSGGAHVETHFYNHIRPHVEIEAPKSFYALYETKSYKYMVMLGDLTSSVTEFCNHHTVMTLARAQSQVRLLGKLHGTTYSNPHLQAEMEHIKTWPEFFNDTLAFGMQSGSENGFQASEEVIPPSLFKRYQEIWPATMRSMEIHQKGPYYYAHGDVHLKNWYVAGSGEMGLSDWQCCGRGHWARDFAYTIATALKVEDRRAWERDLLKLYLETQRAAGGPAISFDDAWNAYRQQLITALTWWTVTLTPPPGLPDMQPRDITLEFIRRISTAMDDNGTLDAF